MRFSRLAAVLGFLALASTAAAQQAAPAQESAQQPAASLPQQEDVSALALEPGLSMRVFDVGQSMTRLPNLIEGQTGNVNKLVTLIELANEDFGLEDRFLTELDGWLVIDQPGYYEFELLSDDGSAIYVGKTLVVNNDGWNTGEVAVEGVIELKAGTYPIRIRHFDQGGKAGLRVRWRTPGSNRFELLGGDVLRTEANQVRVTAPGQKVVELVTGEGMAMARRPGDMRPLEGVHPAFDLVNIRPEGFEPKVGGIDFLPDGRLILCTWTPEGEVLILDGIRGDDVTAERVVVKRFAAGLAEPLGIKVVPGSSGDPGDYRIYVLQKQELTELIDHDKDGVADEYRAISGGWPVTNNFHEFAFGLAEKNGKLYGNLAVAINPGGSTTDPQVPGRGTAIEIDPAAGTYRVVAAGLRTPNGVGIGVDGEVFLTDNQGDWLPSSKLIHLKEGAFYGSHINPPNPLATKRPTPPVAWLPQGEIGNSPGNPLLVPEGVGPYAGQMMHSDVTHGGVKRVFVEKIAPDGTVVTGASAEGDYQGCVFRFTQGLEAGVNRIAFGPDGDLYAGGIGSTGDWGQAGKQRFGLQKLSFNEKVPFEMLAVRPATGGVEIEFTKPLAEGVGTDPQNYRLKHWYYEPTSTYGGPKMGEEILSISAVQVAPDRKRVFLATEGLMAGRVVHVHLRGVRGEGNEEPWSTEAWYTLNRIPNRQFEYVPAQSPPATRTAAAEEGFDVLFNGTLDSARGHWRGFKKEDLPAGWTVEDGALLLKGEGAGDIITRQSFKDFDLRLEWKIAEGGNSGIMYRVSETGEGTEATYLTGPEYQLLDDVKAADNKTTMTRAGALYGIYPAPDPSPVKPANEWNEARIVVKGNHVEHWLNGQKIVDAEIGSDDWNQRLAASKFATWPRFARETEGHIALQDHGNPVFFRNIRVKRLEE